MVQNIAIIGLNRELAYEVSKQLAEELYMHFFDCLQLFEFDNIPRTFPELLEQFGEQYYRKKEKSLTEYASGFNECVINFESGVCECVSNLETIKSNCLLIYLHITPSRLKKKLEKNKYGTEQEKNFYDIPIEKINNRVKILKANCNITINANQGSVWKLTSDILRAIKVYYNVKN